MHNSVGIVLNKMLPRFFVVVFRTYGILLQTAELKNVLPLKYLYVVDARFHVAFL